MPRVRRSPAEESAGFFVWQQFCIFAAVKKKTPLSRGCSRVRNRNAIAQGFGGEAPE